MITDTILRVSNFYIYYKLSKVRGNPSNIIGNEDFISLRALEMTLFTISPGNNFFY